MLLQLARVWEVEAACVRGSPFLSDARLIADAFVPSLHAAIARQCHRLSSVVHAHFRAAFVATAALCTRLSLPHHATARVLKQWDIRSYATLRRNEIASDVESVLAGSEPAVLSLDTKQRTFSSPKSFLLCLPPPPPSFSWLPFSSSSSPCPPRFPPFFPHAPPHPVQPPPPPLFFSTTSWCLHPQFRSASNRQMRPLCARVRRRLRSRGAATSFSRKHMPLRGRSQFRFAPCFVSLWVVSVSVDDGQRCGEAASCLLCVQPAIVRNSARFSHLHTFHFDCFTLPPPNTHTHTLSLSHPSTSPPLHLSTSPPLHLSTSSICNAHFRL